MPSTTLQQLGSVAQALLDESVSVLSTTALGVPESQHLVASRPAIDCEFVAVQMARLAEDATSPLAALDTKRRNRFGNVIMATFVIYVVRCAANPIGMAATPTDAAKTASAHEVIEDAWASPSR
jgi:hypothetical protein